MEPDAETSSPPLPIENPDLVGHEVAEQTLRQAYHSGRLAHAWLISGPKGIGKATLAHRFARYILSDGGKSGVPVPSEPVSGPSLFGEDEAPAEGNPGNDETGQGLYIQPDHPVFLRAVAGSHADLMVIERELDEKTGRYKGQIVVDAVRGVKGFLGLTAGEGTWRVVVVDAADELNRNAANALLKALEEPPAQAVILLVCHNAGRLLPTIRSRCRQLPLRPPPLDASAAYVRSWHSEMPDAQAANLMAVTDGSIGLALELAEAGDLGLVSEVSAMMVRVTETDATEALHKLASRLGQAGREAEFEVFLRVVRWWLERIVVTKSGGATVGFENDAVLTKLKDLASLDRWLEVWEKVSRLFDSVAVANLDRKQVVLNTFLTVAAAVGSNK